MENTPPKTGIQIGMDGGILRPRIIPVTRALPSLMVTGFFIKTSNTYSLRTQESTVAATTRSE